MRKIDSETAVALDAAIDAALARALSPPQVPDHFRQRLRAALVRASGTDSIQLQRARLEREYREELTALRRGYVRLRRRTLTTLIGGTVAIGGSITLLFPWFSDVFGPHAAAAVAVFGGVLGLSIGVDASRVRALPV